MLKWAVIFFVVAAVAASLRYGGVSGVASSIALVLFWIFLVVTIVLFLFGIVSGRRNSI